MQQTTTKPCLEKAVVKVGDIEIGGKTPVIIAGPCAVESREQIIEIAYAVKEAGAHMLRGGAYKPRTDPDSFQGLGEKGLEYLAEARERTGLPFVTEVMDSEEINLLSKYAADMLQVGARDMQAYRLLTAVGRKTDKPVLLKRGLWATPNELLSAAEYITKERKEKGTEPNIVLCLRGVRKSRNSERCDSDYRDDLPELRKMTNYPILFDPSHAVGNGRSKREHELVKTQIVKAAKAALDARVDGLIVEVYPDAINKAKCDAHQQLSIEQFREIVEYARTLQPKSMKDERYLRKEIRLAWEC